MSDRRVKYIVLASIIFVGIVGISQGQGLFELNDVNPITPRPSLATLGHVTAFLKDSDGNIKAYHQTDNLITDRGANCGSDLVLGTTFSPVTCLIVNRIAIGSSSVTVDPIQTNLLDKTTNGNVVATLTGVVSTSGANESPDLILQNTFTMLAADNGDSIGEAGLFAANDNMFARTLIGPFSMVSTGSEVQVIWTMHIE